MTKDVKVSFYLKRNETKKDGKSPVMARLSIGKNSESTPSRVQSSSLELPRPKEEDKVKPSLVRKWPFRQICGHPAGHREKSRGKRDQPAVGRNQGIRPLALSGTLAVRENVTADDVKNLLLDIIENKCKGFFV